VIVILMFVMRVSYLSASFVPGTGFDNYSSGIISVDFIYNEKTYNAVICDFDRDGSKLDPRFFCSLLG